MKKKREDLSNKDISSIFKQAIDLIDKLDDNLEDLVEFSCNLKLLLRKIKNKVNSGVEKEEKTVKMLAPPINKEILSLNDLIIIDANDLELLDGSEEI
ncbi:MAG: hypothetical protein JW891_03095 [Candidatus Lokiarchaeota archaeon]|nr:hypothetical protein [Candidatus Lokiarchaeota archaeon]